MTIYRQGDVLLVAINSIPANARTEVARDNGRIVLAYGEVTGHAHAIHDTEAVLLAAPDTEDRFLRIMATVALEHEASKGFHILPIEPHNPTLPRHTRPRSPGLAHSRDCFPGLHAGS